MTHPNVLRYLSGAMFLFAMTGCATGPDTQSQRTKAPLSSTTTQIINSAPVSFTNTEIRDISAAFEAGSCSLSKLTEQGKKYDLDNTWVNLYERTPKPLSSLDQTHRCFLAQSNELYAYSDEFYGESPESLNQTWFKKAADIPNDAHIVSMRYVTPTVLLANCDPDLGRPAIIDYEKDAQGHIQRTIFINEDFDPSCVHQ